MLRVERRGGWSEGGLVPQAATSPFGEMKLWKIMVMKFAASRACFFPCVLDVITNNRIETDDFIDGR
jgi:hypothetical protein